MSILRIAFVAVAAAVWPLTAAAQNATSRAEPVERLAERPDSRGCAVSFTAVVVNADGSPNLLDGARGSLTLLLLNNGRGLLGVKLSAVHRETTEGALVARAPAQVLLFRGGQSNPQELLALRPSDTPDFAVASFRIDGPLTSAVLRDLETSGRMRVGYRLIPDGPMLMLDIDIAARRDNRDSQSIDAWRDCAAAARRPRSEEAAPG